MTESTVKVQGNTNLRVIIVDDESNQIPAVLGITPEREQELDKIIQECYEGYDTITDTIAEMSKRMKHANELAFCAFHIGAHVARSKIMGDKVQSMEEMVKKMLRGGSTGNKSNESED